MNEALCAAVREPYSLLVNKPWHRVPQRADGKTNEHHADCQFVMLIQSADPTRTHNPNENSVGDQLTQETQRN